MKKQMILFAAFCMAAVANAQTTITVDKALGTPSETKKLNDAVYKGANGLAFIGDARQLKEDGKEQGLVHEKVTKYFKADGKTIKATAAVNFQKAPVGVKNKANNIIPYKAPHNRAVEFKPASEGKLYALVWSKNPSARLFYAVANNGIYDLRGQKVGTSDDYDRLPAGIYIINGKKSVKK